jgi:endonuclease/exonuclease/phosphatase family metal-dependent hydrolase
VAPPGQVVVATLNARQPKVLGLSSFQRLYSMVLAIRNRPAAFNGGAADAVSAPDVIIAQEVTYSNLEIFQNILNQTSRFDYQIAVADGSLPKFLYNASTVSLVGTPIAWIDPCKTGTDGKGIRRYQYARFLEVGSNLGFTVAGVHLSNNYTGSGGNNCRLSNVVELRRQLVAETNPVIVGGDFNYRPVAQQHECDPDERSEPTAWWSMMTSPVVGEPSYVDVVRESYRRRGVSMAGAWTREALVSSPTCKGNKALRRSRIDYLFSLGATVAEAHPDTPAWALGRPGPYAPEDRRFSDHRFVWGRFVLGGPERPTVPVAQQRRNGVIEVAWQPVDGATGYVLYRKRKGERYSALQKLDAASTSFTDPQTADQASYRYAVAAVGPGGAQGLESRPVAEVADARGPRVIKFSPFYGASRVARSARVYVRFGENVDPASVGSSTIRLIQKAKWKNGRDKTIGGRVVVDGARVLKFVPNRRLERRRSYVVVVAAVQDRLGNRGPRASSRFST